MSTFIGQLIGFAVIVAIIVKYVVPPLRKLMADQRQAVATQLEESAKATVPIPTINLGGRWNFSKKVRMLLFQQMFGLKIGDYEGKLDNTRILAEWSINRHFGIGGGIERVNLEFDAESDDFRGALDSGYTAFTLYIRGQF